MNVVELIVEIGGCFVDPIKKHCGYLINYNRNIKDLDDKIQKLHDKREVMEREIGEETRNGQVITREAETWIEKVRNILGEDDEKNKMSLNGWCRRYSLSKRAKKKTQEIDGLLEDRRSVKVSHPPLPSGMKPLPVKDIKDFESRTNKMNELLEALRDDEVNMIAICGMAGIGKTSMAKVVANRAKFDEVALAVVSENKDESKIQDEIAGMLGLKLEKDPLFHRAERLKLRLTDKKRKLVILDDVWDELDLEKVGIPCGVQHCKILLTSRREEACTRMKSQKIFSIRELHEEEAFTLFKEMAGNYIERNPIQKDVAKECGGLPLAIVTVGKALANKSEVEWIAALDWLKMSNPKNIPELDSEVYSSIKRSYNYLNSDEAKHCFLLCCLFAEDSDIHIEFLVRYGKAEARNGIHAIVKNLKRSFLLLDSERGEQFVKMHDVVRDVAISIAENHDFLVRCNDKMEEWPEKDSCKRYTTISLASKKLKRHPDGLECPKLELLQLSCDRETLQTLPPNLFRGMKGLKFLSLFRMSLPLLPRSINVLEDLRTLQFVSCEITDVSAIGELRKLEILSFIESKIKELPGEMRNLSNLKLLDLTKCNHLERFPPDLLSNLSHLEELYMLGVDVKWKPMEKEDEDEEEEEVDKEEEEEKEGANASLTELMSLSYLVALKIQIPNIKVLPKDLPFKKETIKFQIFASNNVKIDEHNFTEYNDCLIKNSLGLASCDVSDIAENQMLLQLFKKSEILELKEIKDLKNIVYELDKEGFQCLKVLEVGGSDDVEYIMDATSDQNPRAAFPILESLKVFRLNNLEEIYHGQFLERSLSNVCFGNLKSIEVSKCHRLRYLFPTSIAKLLVELQSIKIEECDAIENIVQRDGEEEDKDIILFPRVSSLKLKELPNMKSFCIKAYSFEWSSIKEIYLYHCPELKTNGSEIQSPRKSKKINRELDSRPNEHELGCPCFLWRCLGDSNNSLEIWSLFPSRMIGCLKNLESIELGGFHSEVLFQLEELNVEESHMALVLNQLRKLILYGLDNLLHIWKKGPERILGFGNMRFLKVEKCNSLTYLFSPSIAKLLVMLEEIRVTDCRKIEEILARAREEEEEKDVLFHKVNLILLSDLPNLKCFCNEANALEWPSLKEITVIGCPALSTFIRSNLNTPKLEVVHGRTCHWEGKLKLNATIEHIFKGKEKQANHETKQEEQIETIEKDM